MRGAAIIAAKDLQLLCRDRVALFWVLVFPLLFALFFGAVFSAALDRDSARISIALVHRADGAELDRIATALLDNPGLSVSQLDREAAALAVRRGDAIGYVQLNGATVGKPPIELGVDPSRPQEASLMRAAVIQAVYAMQSAAAGPKHAPVLDVQSVNVVSRSQTPSNAFDIVFPAAVLWGLMGCTACFAIAMVSERTVGTLLRLRAAPISRTEILAGKALACFVACLLDILLLTLLAGVIFELRIERPGLMAAVVLSTAFCFVGITMLLSVLGKTERAVAGAGWATLIVMAMLGGAMIPLSVMPEWMQNLSDLSPVKWAIMALEGILWRGLPASEIFASCLVLVGIGIVGFVAGLELLARNETG